ncbi:MAG TPA: iron-containing alcohol dehydrogenase family protein [Aequorivita sp.]|jgi:glycerol-1-phosphate dehydrogenase [NAD(P)+]|nr:iron-containing alcohol dehydrogenase family protein [Aequorivita sp.]
MIYQQQSYLPIIFQVDEGIILKVDDFLKRNNLSFSNVLVVSGKSFSKKFANQLIEKNSWNSYIIENNGFRDVEKLRQYVNHNRIDLIIGVGGGKVIDTVKRVSYYTNINHFSVPTIISNDGLISPIAVIKNDSGKTESLPGIMPMGVLIDIEIIKESPITFIRAAAGDILSNISATNDWVLALQKSNERMNDIAFHLSKSAANSLVYFRDINLRDKQFLRLVVQGQINSGIAMSLAGTSRPCSGSEHLISHAIDFLELSNVLHGTQVASISLFTLFLQKKIKPIHIQYAQSTEIPLDFTSFTKGFSNELFNEIIDKAREMRPGRYTILDEYTNEALFDKFIEFQGFLKKNNRRFK